VIFPFFLFIVGVAVHLSRRASVGEAVRRTLVLAGLGLFLAAWPFWPLSRLSGLRFPGVLQRIAVCYLATFLARRYLGWRGQLALAAALLVGYQWLLTGVTLPDGTPPNLGPGTSLAAWVDRALLDGHLWRQSKTWDPEGPLSTLPAIATTLLGLLAGGWLRGARRPQAKALGLLGGGFVLTLAGLAWGAWFPINKSLWTSSYAVFTAGLAAYALGFVYWLADVRGYRAWTRPLVVYGVNAIFVFVASGLLAKTLLIVKLPAAGGPVSLYRWLHETLFLTWASPVNASLAFALANVLLFYLVLLWLDRRGLHFKV
jgi:predicted acyltransferase